ncbi:UDP-N-acetylmuramoyl-tripeptide--D-alanyl-D-alanine ligase [Pseudoclavibacter chungangensis]|nr:UDP-N-acetylmuramoyl-tripeptide--D-alanyl-D-alanine ligase [Pseudoclavibacter chungangensis]NYJ66791.1 UDP-N-acetylmuramoyl-tripeptide--D-alanyl-D-alanine ligase [Pseudoclavibacter chungangensis]
MTLQDIADVTAGTLVLRGGATAETVVEGLVDTDSRKIGPGDVFVAKPGEETDGHLFAPKAVEAGAALVIDERELDLDVPQIVVANAVEALGALGTEVVRRVRSLGRLREIAVTGSNGKTTTKNLLQAIFSRRGETVAPIASFNNEVGAPITFCRLTASTRYLIAEMGASAPGEITRLTRMAKPDVGIVLTVGLAHAGEFGGIEVTLRSKTEMVQALDEGDVAVLNADDARVRTMAEKTAARVVWFGRGDDADVRASDVTTSLDGTRFTLHVPGEEPVDVHFAVIGEHHVTNALAAAAAAHVEGVSAADVRDALQEVTRAERWRMEVVHRGPVTVINDAYNASPDSMSAALRTLAQIAPPDARTIAVLGEMSELGPYAIEEHDRIGLLAVRLNIDQLVVVGRGARALHLGAIAQGSWSGESRFVEDADEAYTLLEAELRPGDIVLVKSSNSAGLRFLGDRLADLAEGRDA